MKRAIMAAAVAILVMATIAHAGVNRECKVAVHVEAYASNRACAAGKGVTGPPVITSCEDIQTTYAGFNVDAFPVFFDMTEYQGFDYSMTWVGSYGTFTSCSGLTIGGYNPFWQADAVGKDWQNQSVSHAWSTCQSYSIAIPGWIWLYSYGQICVVNHVTANTITVGDCATPSEPDTILADKSVACAGTNGFTGVDPCTLEDIEPSSWGKIKSIFK